MAKKLSDEEREKKEKKVRDTEEENAFLVSDLALLEQEIQAEKDNAELQEKIDEINAVAAGGR